MNRAIRRGLLLGALIATLTMSDALAHGDIGSAEPAAGSTLPRVPGEVSVTFTETPTKGASEITVIDGCDRDVTAGLTLSDHTIRAQVGEARPGSWEVRYRIVSAEDGHPSKGDYRFKVRGKPACSADEPDDGSTPGGTEPPEGASGNPDPDSDSGGSLPWVPIALGTVVLLGAAFLLRRAGG
jgi:methionine-rich copper-binding protein CopC